MLLLLLLLLPYPATAPAATPARASDPLMPANVFKHIYTRRFIWPTHTNTHTHNKGNPRALHAPRPRPLPLLYSPAPPPLGSRVCHLFRCRVAHGEGFNATTPARCPKHHSLLPSDQQLPHMCTCMYVCVCALYELRCKGCFIDL